MKGRKTGKGGVYKCERGCERRRKGENREKYEMKGRKVKIKIGGKENRKGYI